MDDQSLIYHTLDVIVDSQTDKRTCKCRDCSCEFEIVEDKKIWIDYGEYFMERVRHNANVGIRMVAFDDIDRLSPFDDFLDGIK